MGTFRMTNYNNSAYVIYLSTNIHQSRNNSSRVMLSQTDKVFENCRKNIDLIFFVPSGKLKIKYKLFCQFIILNVKN